MYEIIIEQEIASAHQLAGYKGKCEKLHGHNWKVQLEVMRETLDEIGLAIDFTDVKHILTTVLGKYDHVMLNELPEFSQINPTSENLARILYQQCKTALTAFPVQIKAVRVWESPRSSVRYHE